MAFAFTLSALTPAGTDLISLGDDNIRDYKSAMIERVNSRFVDVNSDPWILKSPGAGTGNSQTLIPSSDNLYNLGEGARRWADLRAVTATISGALSGQVPAAGRGVTALASYLLNDSVFNVKDFLAIGDGVAVDDVPIQNAINAAVATGYGGKVRLPSSANYKVTTKLSVTTYGVHIVGDGDRTSFILFDPAVDQVCFEFLNSNAAITLSDCSISNISFRSTGVNTKVKTAVQLTDCSEVVLQNVHVLNSWISLGNQNATPSIGLQIKGRELMTVTKCTFFADRPIDVLPNPRTGGGLI